ncbi:MAG: HAD-IIIA family hydrolase [Phycisphaeraceae bacterium JB051]
MNAAVFLDRDNTIIHNDGDLGDPKEVKLIQGAASAIASLRGLGYLIVIVTNQGGVARGKYGVEDVDKVHERITQLVYENAGAKIDRFYFCPYHPLGKVEKYTREHPWRKPQPGMLIQAQKDLQIDMDQSWMIGDALRDIEAGAAAGVRTILLKPDAQTLPPLKASEHGAGDEAVRPDFVASTIIEATRVIAQQRRPDRVGADWEPAGEKVNKNLKPANEGKDAADAPKRMASKPFRPWNAPVSEQVSVEPESAPADITDEPVAPVAEKAPVESAPKPVTEPQVTPTPKPVTEPSKPQVKSPTSQPELQAPPPTQSVEPPPPAPKPTQPADESDLDEPAVLLSDRAPASDQGEAENGDEQTLRFDGGATRLLRLIHQELKNQHAHKGEFSWLRMFAAMLQLIAIVCLFAALWLGTGSSAEDGSEVFFAMMGTALFTQMATIAMLMFDRR